MDDVARTNAVSGAVGPSQTITHRYRLSEQEQVSSWAERWTRVKRAATTCARLEGCERVHRAVLTTIFGESDVTPQESYLSEEIAFPAEEELEDEASEEGLVPPQAPSADEDTMDELSTGEKELLMKLHVNLGHPSRERLVQALSVAGARPSVIRYAREGLECASCRSGARQHMRRQAALPRTYQLNKLLGLDTFSVRVYPHSSSAETAQEYHVLNIVCHGSSFQMCAVLPRLSALEVRRAFQSVWLRPFGAPEAVLSDAGSEFAADFDSSL
eukprot:4133706-Amphidinium_carterae.2